MLQAAASRSRAGKPVKPFWCMALAWLAAAGAAGAQTDGLVYGDRIYSETIKTVLLYPQAANPENPARLVAPPVISLQAGTRLVLEFDDLTADYRAFRAKIFHCNADWSGSVLNEVEYTREFNDYPVTEARQSFSTKIPYYHYTFIVPQVRISGNYVLVVFNERDRTPVCSRRFMVYDTKVRVQAQARFSQGINQQHTDQQIDFGIDYKGFPLVAPQTDLKVFIRQNFRWDRMKSDFRPTNVNVFDQKLTYQFFNLENTFRGGNEFRFFDSRTLAGRGFGIYEIDRLPEYTRLILGPDRSRNFDAYLQMDDFNGGYVVDHRESGRGSVEADYTPVVFTLKIPELPEGREIYVNGAFNLWQNNELNRMEFENDSQSYQAVILLKQGVVNYNYTVYDPASRLYSESLVEGDYSATENDYDILVYYRPPAGRSDLLVGYSTIEWNRRR